MNTDKIYAQNIANEYAPKDTRKIVALKKLDQRAKLPAVITVYSLGIIMALLLGVGMCLCMKVIGNGSTAKFIFGIIIGIIGIIGVSINYPIYRKLLAKGKEKYSAAIIQLASEIAEENA